MENDDLLSQLNGELPEFVGDDAEAQKPAPSRESELTVKPAPRLNPVAAADARHATSAGGKGYRVKVKGDYFAPNPDGRGKIKKPFTLEINVPKLEGCASVIKNKLLLPALQRIDPSATRHRSFRIVSSTPLNAATPKSRSLDSMDRAQLEEYVLSAAPAIPLELESYAQTEDGTIALREAIIDYVQNPSGFAEREAERKSKRDEDNALALLNPGLVG